MEALVVGAVVYIVTGALTIAVAAHTSAVSDHDGLPWKLLAVLATAGALLGLGKLLASKEQLTPRLMLGRAIVSGGLAVAAGAALAFIPNLSVLAVCGLAAVFAVLGEQYVEKLLNDRIPK
jgi:membrane protein implicated in regulation of membrane protease activity